MKLILMKQTLQLILNQSSIGDIEASNKLNYFDTMNIVEKETYFVLTEKL